MELSLPIGTILAKTHPEFDDQSGKVYLRQIQLSGRTTTAYVKNQDEEAARFEAVIALLGRSLDLPIPQPLLIKVNPGELPFSRESPFLAFASEKVDGRTLTEWCNERGEGLLWDLFQDPFYSSIRRALEFDEWVGNSDRHLRNILFDGREQFWFIDHERPERPDFPASECDVPNELFDLFRKQSAEMLSERLYGEVDAAALNFDRVPYDKVMTEMVRSWGTWSKESGDYFRWLKVRARNMPVILSNKFWKHARCTQGAHWVDSTITTSELEREAAILFDDPETEYEPEGEEMNVEKETLELDDNQWGPPILFLDRFKKVSHARSR